MAPSKPFPSVSRLIDERFEQKAMEIHLRKLEAVKAVVDTAEPEYMHHLDRNAKKEEREAGKQLEIAQENARLYNKLAAIEDFDSTSVLRSSSVRSSLNAKPGMFYSTVGGHQCVDHINLTATSNPRSLHYKGPSVPPSRGSTRTPSRAATRPVSRQDSVAGEGSMEDWESTPHGVGHGLMRGSAEVDMEGLGMAQRSKSVSASGSYGGRLLRTMQGPGIPYLAASVPPPAPPPCASMGPQPWSGQLARSRRATGDHEGEALGERHSYRISTASSIGVPGIGRRPTGEEGGPSGGAGECSLPHIGGLPHRASREVGEQNLSNPDLQPGDAGLGTGGLPRDSASVCDATLAARAAATTLLAQPPSAPAPPRARPGLSRGPSFGSTPASAPAPGSAYASPHKPPVGSLSRGASPMRGRTPSVSRSASPTKTRGPRCDAPLPPGHSTVSMSMSMSRSHSPAGSRCASPLRRSFQGEADGDATYNFAPDHGLRKEILKSTYLQGVTVQPKGNSIMATRRSASYTSLGNACGTPPRESRYSNSVDDDDI